MNPKGQGQIDRALNTLDKSTSVDMLRDNSYLLFVFKKTERIVVAIYFITGLMNESEPLRHSLRTSSLSFLKDILSLRGQSVSHQTSFAGNSPRALTELISLVDLAHVTGFISPMNFVVLKKEFAFLQEAVTKKWRASTGSGTDETVLDEDFFGVAKTVFERNIDERPPKQATIRTMEEFAKIQEGIKDKSVKGQSMSDKSVLYRTPDVAAKESLEGNTSAIPQKRIRTSGSLKKDAKELRRGRVMDLMREVKTAIVKDFLTVVEGCSEKTVQRLLADLVEEGVLKREGERRWSRYSLVEGH
jgi:hypothetical protein